MKMVQIDRIVVEFKGKREEESEDLDEMKIIKKDGRNEIIWIDKKEEEGEDEKIGGREMEEEMERNGVGVEVMEIE